MLTLDILLLGMTFLNKKILKHCCGWCKQVHIQSPRVHVSNQSEQVASPDLHQSMDREFSNNSNKTTYRHHLKLETRCVQSLFLKLCHLGKPRSLIHEVRRLRWFVTFPALGYQPEGHVRFGPVSQRKECMIRPAREYFGHGHQINIGRNLMSASKCRILLVICAKSAGIQPRVQCIYC